MAHHGNEFASTVSKRFAGKTSISCLRSGIVIIGLEFAIQKF